MAIARVQVTVGGNEALASSVATVAFGSNTTTGNTILAFVRTSGTADVTSVQDTVGNIYTQQASTEGTNPSLWIFVHVGITGGASQVVTANLSPNDQFIWIAAAEYSGVTGVDLANARFVAGAATDLTSTAFSTAAGAEMVVMAASQNNFAAYTAGTDFTIVDGTLPTSPNDYGGYEQYLPAGVLSSYTAHITSNVSASYAVAWIALSGAVTPAAGDAPPIGILGRGAGW